MLVYTTASAYDVYLCACFVCCTTCTAVWIWPQADFYAGRWSKSSSTRVMLGSVFAPATVWPIGCRNVVGCFVGLFGVRGGWNCYYPSHRWYSFGSNDVGIAVCWFGSITTNLITVGNGQTCATSLSCSWDEYTCARVDHEWYTLPFNL